MSERRSGRPHKSINYARFGESVDEDDDFQDAKNQKEKRSKLSQDKSSKKGEANKLKSLSQNSDEGEKTNKSSRQSVDEKVFQRQLKVVLERSKTDASMSEGKQSVSPSSSSVSTKKKECSPVFQKFCEKVTKDSSCMSPAKNDSNESTGLIDDMEQHSSEDEQIEASPINRGVASTEVVAKRKKVISTAVTRNNASSPDISLVSPVKKSGTKLLSYRGLRLGLSRKVSIKPLHAGVIKIS